MSKQKVMVAGAAGMAGSAVCRACAEASIEFIPVTRADADLTDTYAVDSVMQSAKPSHLVIAAAKVGGIKANDSYSADFIVENLAIQLNLIQSAHKVGVETVVFLGSSCIYPKDADQPIAENALLTGELEATNEAYAVAKIAGIKMCEAFNKQYDTDYRSLMPTNLYGPGDNFHETNSHVIPALIRRIHDAKVSADPSVSIWGSGNPKREFLHVDDLALAVLHFLNLPKVEFWQSRPHRESHINVGTGVDLSIRELAGKIASVVDYGGELTFDASMPDGTPRKCLNISRAKNLGWSYTIDLDTGLQQTYDWYLNNQLLVRS